MREILFRGKAINRGKFENYRTNYKNGDWVYGLLTRKFDNRFENLPAEMTNEDGVSGIEVDYKTIGQYTGLTDKNGKKIFEGDILKGRFYGFPVIKDDFVFSVSWQDDVKGFKSNYFEANLCEVIGNIHDNPELLKGE